MEELYIVVTNILTIYDKEIFRRMSGTERENGI
jgi:hypothetical protein